MELDILKKIMAEQFSVEEDEITLDTQFEDLGADSLDIAELVMALEEEFDIEIGDDDLASAHTVGDVVDYLRNRVGD
ncbi:MAG: acyl carrier protein [Eubacteriales bacterium]|jgi:acyl carrier protein